MNPLQLNPIAQIFLYHLVALAAACGSACCQDFNYVTNGGAITITEYHGPGGSVVIPESITGRPVTSIGWSAFFSRSDLNSVVVPDTVTNIGPSGFQNCSGLTNVVLGKGLRALEESSFKLCEALPAITIPDSVTNVGSQAFSHCTSLASLSLGSNIASIGSNAFSSCLTLASASIPQSVTKIGSAAFKDCSTLTNVVFANGLVEIGDSAFASCIKLRDINLPDSLTSMGLYCFDGCGELTNAVLGKRLASLPQGAFYDCWKLKTVTLPADLSSIGIWAFGSCALLSVRIGSGVTNIGDGAFQACFRMAEISVAPDNPNYSVLDGVLFDKSQRTLVACPGGRTGNYEVPSTVTSIGNMAFSGCRQLTNIYVGTNVIHLGIQAFASCYALKGAYFSADAPSVDLEPLLFLSSNGSRVYYLPGTSGWGPALGGRPTALWLPTAQLGRSSLDVNKDVFGFNVAWRNGMTVVVETSTDLAGSVWIPLVTNSIANGSFYFSDAEWTNYPTRFYRVRSP